MSRIALVTGANRGLGLASATAFARAGATVIVAGRDANSVHHAVEKIASEGLAAEALTLDVTSPSEVMAAAATVADRHGRLDVLVNNAGILPEATSRAEVEFIDVDALARTFATNVLGVAIVTESFLPLLRLSTAGRIVNISSTMGSLKDQSDPDSLFRHSAFPAYRASKSAVNSLTIELSKQLADTQIKVTAVCPGWVQTDLAPGNREHAPTTAEEAVKVVLAAASLPDDAPSGAFISSAGQVAW
ncbi:SDR family NAD(P)-dependent oxidoreductase [Microbacterium sp. H1-D42]|uniref:SDR family NAD(P)-dependent oxidoreductase n=1 Tax=Microbacterium sp. H1-D42 TaxID=2925844 RepID=UPI001F53BACF|nr:SDR family NAD(P)-dependent oxidoreductase [Microbacterium sp. H1-D42]UNK70305.1 SDR family NAD(P)-dependent oxidoreductase [Microbacterium sp. H1-D42]